MYLIFIILLMFIFPAASVLIEALRAGSGADWMLLVGKWFVFWAVGIRLSSPACVKSFSRDSPPRPFSRSRTSPSMPWCAKSPEGEAGPQDLEK
jgi:hypothetical protein